jgi:predicted TPR repeat methyltransferase
MSVTARNDAPAEPGEGTAAPAAARTHVEERAEMSYSEAFQLATQLHRGAQLEPAQRLYEALRALNDADPNPMHYLGVLLLQRGRRDEGLALIRRSLEADPSVAAWHNNLGNALLDADRYDEAEAAYRRCSELDPDNAEVLSNLGVLQRSLGRLDEAEATLKRAIERHPKSADAHSNLAALYYAQRRIKEGYRHSAEALALQPAHVGARHTLAVLYARLGRLEEAAALYREWLAQDPDNMQARHLLAGCTGQDVPERADDAYVERVFDHFANSFDARLASLEYRAPQLVADAVGARLGAPCADRDIVDAGCGTGLCGPLLAPHARRLVGVDLSANMIEKARARGVYDELVKGELVAQLAAAPGSADVVVSADTLCYFGALDGALAAARAALRPGGLLVFTVEAHDEPVDHRLNPHGRYSHHADYLRRTLDASGFADVRLEPVVLRFESGEPVAGWLAGAVAEGA